MSYLSIWDIGRMEKASLLWREMLKEFDSGPIWQKAVHQKHGYTLIETLKVALGFRHGQSFEQEGEDLLPPNWKRIMRMERSGQRFPQYTRTPHVIELRDHTGPVLAMCTAGPYLFTGGADKCIQLYRIPIFLNYTPEKAKDKVPPHPSRSFGVGGIAHDGPVLCLAAERDLVVSGSTDGVLKVWKVESAPGSSAHRVVKGHAGPLWCVCFVDGKYIATGSADNTACFWEVDMAKQAKPYMVFRGHSGGVTAICSVPDVEQVVSLLRMAAPPASCLLLLVYQVVTGSEDGTIRIWTYDGMCPSVLEGHASPIFSIRCWRSGARHPEVPPSPHFPLR
ncbi:WD40-repeat-containing domain protein [Baffinella frigidus]|nr:WD40-repeat-containing domain protein [Cryptophyta sp. CCMP2293]